VRRVRVRARACAGRFYGACDVYGAHRCLGPAGQAEMEPLQVGRQVPTSWSDGREVVWGGWEAEEGPEQGDMVAVRRSDGSLRLGQVEEVEPAQPAPQGRGSPSSRVAWQGRVWVCVSGGPRGSSLSRLETANPLGRVTLPRVEAMRARRAASRSLAALAVEEELLRYCIPQDLATVLWALARMSLLNKPIIRAVLRRALHPVTLRKARPRDLATMLWALAQLGVRDVAAVAAISRALVLVSGLSGALPAAAAGGGVGGKEAQAVGGAIAGEAHTSVNGQDVSNALWALGRLGLCDGKVSYALVAAAVRLVQDDAAAFKSQAVTNVLWAAAELALPVSPPDKADGRRGEEIRDMCSQIAAASAAGGAKGEASRRKVVGEWSVQGAATSLWAMAVLGIASRACVQPLAEALLDVLNSRTHLLQDSDYGQLHQYFLAATLLHTLAPPPLPSSAISPAGEAQGGRGVLAGRFGALQRKSAQVFAGTSARFQTKSEAQLELARESLCARAPLCRPCFFCTDARGSFP